MDNLQDLQAAMMLWSRFDRLFSSQVCCTDFLASKKLLWEKAAEQKNQSDPERTVLQFEQFIVGTLALRNAQERGEVGEMGSWIQWALTTEPTDEPIHELEIGRFIAFENYNAFASWPGFIPLKVIFFNGFFDYVRRRTAFKEIAEELWVIASLTFVTTLSFPPDHIDVPEIMLGCMMLTWAAKESFERAKVLTPLIEACVSRSDLHPALRSRLSLTLATNGGRFSEQDSTYWSSRTLVDFGDYLSSLDKAQMMSTTLSVDSNGPKDAALVIAQMALVRKERSKGQSLLSATRGAAQTIEYILPFFWKTLAMNEAGLLLQGLQVWYGQSDPKVPLDANKVLITLPFGQISTSFLIDGGKYDLLRDTQSVLVDVSHAMNDFLGTYSTVAYADNSKIPFPERPGVPKELQRNLLPALAKAYCPLGMSMPRNAESQIILPMEGHPIQTTQLAVWGQTWPISSSLSGNRQERKLRSVLIWGGGTITEPMETEMVETAFRSAGASVKVVAPLTCTAANFLNEYQNTEYDIFWVASHGEFNHWSPEKVQLHLCPEKTSVSLEDLWNKAPITDERRLLVLNVCDGARFAEPGLLPRIGLAPGLASASQTTISHLWPVRPYPSAAFGAYLAYYLAQSESYFSAYQASLKSLRKSSSDIGLELAELYGKEFELTTRLSKQEEDFSVFETWGSAAFFH